MHYNNCFVLPQRQGSIESKQGIYEKKSSFNNQSNEYSHCKNSHNQYYVINKQYYPSYTYMYQGVQHFKKSCTKFQNHLISLKSFWFHVISVISKISLNILNSRFLEKNLYKLCTVEPVYWTPWDQLTVSWLLRCPDFPGQFI